MILLQRNIQISYQFIEIDVHCKKFGVKFHKIINCKIIQQNYDISTESYELTGNSFPPLPTMFTFFSCIFLEF